MHKSHLLTKGRVSIPHHYYSITLVTHKRTPYFSSLTINRPVTKQLVERCEKLSIDLIAFVIMPDHIHLLIQLSTVTTLSDFIRSFKGTLTSILRPLINNQRLWQRDYYDHMIRNETELLHNARYIIANPLRAKLVQKISQYPYWWCKYL
ncbi:REP-associated tyrosine transposase [Pseudoalteromonas citrea]|uniref:Transposase IS200-like domain-containing protein n=1 Tax=Pseudoalteromonas citrea DSM 8771 TaxID=1117314 RepID=U1KN13_9GAMM|nr:transposase [Pseudoalteromonas citrea]